MYVEVHMYMHVYACRGLRFMPAVILNRPRTLFIEAGSLTNQEFANMAACSVSPVSAFWGRNYKCITRYLYRFWSLNSCSCSYNKCSFRWAICLAPLPPPLIKLQTCCIPWANCMCMVHSEVMSSAEPQKHPPEGARWMLIHALCCLGVGGWCRGHIFSHSVHRSVCKPMHSTKHLKELCCPLQKNVWSTRPNCIWKLNNHLLFVFLYLLRIT